MLFFKQYDLVKIIKNDKTFFGKISEIWKEKNIKNIKIAYFVDNFLNFPKIEFLVYNKTSKNISVTKVTKKEIRKYREAYLSHLKVTYDASSTRMQYIKQHGRVFFDFFDLNENRHSTSVMITDNNKAESPTTTEINALCLGN